MRDMKLEDSTFDIIGEKSVQTALEAGIITKDGIGRIADIPFAFVLM